MASRAQPVDKGLWLRSRPFVRFQLPGCQKWRRNVQPHPILDVTPLGELAESGYPYSTSRALADGWAWHGCEPPMGLDNRPLSDAAADCLKGAVIARDAFPGLPMALEADLTR